MDKPLKEILEVPFPKPLDSDQEIAVIKLDTFAQEAGHIACVPHRIKFYQILFITQGEGTHWVDFEPFPYRSETLFAVEKGQVQVYDLQPGTQGYLILFTEEYLYRYSTDLAWLFNLTLFNSYFSPVLYLSPPDIDELLALITQMAAELISGPNFARGDILRNLLRVFILKAERIKRSQNNANLPDSYKDHDLFIRFRNVLENSYASSREVEAYAAALFTTPKKLNQISHTYLGKTIKQVIDERVVLEIKRLLLHSDLTVQEIARAMGFSDPTNMTKFFKRYTQLTPAQFKSSENGRQ